MKPIRAKTPVELVQAVIHCDNGVDWIDRKLLLQTIGVQDSQRFLPELQQSVAVNLEELTLILKANHPELLQQALETPFHIEQDVPYTPG